MAGRSAFELRNQLHHPIIDCDGHWIESLAVLTYYVEQVAGAAMADRFRASDELGGTSRPEWYDHDDASLLRNRRRRQIWWMTPSSAEDQATFRLPGLLYERLDELGIDFSIVYPTVGLTCDRISEPDLRMAVIRAYNTMTIDLFRPFADRLTPVAVIPRSPVNSAIAELTYCVRELGFKVALIQGTAPARSSGGKRYVDALGLDNEEDYDPLWQACIDLKVAVTSHSGSMTWTDRASVTNFVANHAGHFAQANHLFCRAMLLGGVTRRFPGLNVCFLEGGAGWARNLYLDLISHFEKRNVGTMKRYLDPSQFDAGVFEKLFDRYAGPLGSLKAEYLSGMDTARSSGSMLDHARRETRHVDDFEASGCRSADEVASLFAANFYFGCEADDPMTETAFDRRLGLPLKAVFSSDIAHWDVPDITQVVPEAFELLEHGLLDEAGFKRFTFGNAVRLHGGMNPEFFAGTVIEQAAKRELLEASD